MKLKDLAYLKVLTGRPSLKKIHRALFIQPHPDDNEIGAGGTMAYLIAQGAKVYGLTVTDDALDCDEKDFKDGYSLRQREAISAMKKLGVINAGFLGFADKTEALPAEISIKIVEVIRRIKPDAVFCVDPMLTNECHRDHIRVGIAARYAVMDAACDFYPRLPDGKRHTDTWAVPILGQYYTAKPNIIVDIGKYWSRKCAAVRCHKSQVSEELMGALDIQSRYFGARGFCRRGEALKVLSFNQIHCYNLPV